MSERTRLTCVSTSAAGFGAEQREETRIIPRQAIEAPKTAKPRLKRYHFAGRGQSQIGSMSLKHTLGGAA